ncbi:MAG TPA: AarF/ABC1/UbiB kinase family protein [Solirubrobacteraceae bacterium]|jgi:predicted unusual protein kinase regulating ubiquinone biosynthesis (AarF/ABC1/UbiB family)|nr:AarF/ABC1/UbiB kinase family protein [Solirubrobacteraceae bacterium]
MCPDDDDPPPEAGKLPTGRLGRTARVGGLVTGQGLRWAGMRTANRVRTPERAAAAQSERTAALVEELVNQLGQMRGAAMKVGQMISMVDFDGLAEDEQDELRRKLGALRDDVPPVPFAHLEKLMRREFGGPLRRIFSDFDERAFAAASIGQVHRATTVDGDDVVVKVQYPGVAEAVETDLRNAMLLLPLVKRLAPGLDAKALAAELRERIGEELDYELEAQNQRRIERLMREHPFARVPRVRTDLSTRRVLVSEYIEGERFEAVRRADEAQRDRYGEIVFRFYFGLLYRDLIALGDPHPGNYLLCPDGGVGFLDFGLVRDLDAARVADERAIALAVRDGDPAALKSALLSGGYLPGSRADAVDADWALRLMRAVIKWYAVPGERRFSPDGARNGRDRERPDSEQRAAAKQQVNQFTLPPESILIRRMHALVAIVLMQLRAGADWGAIAAEYLHAAPPATPLGQAEADYFARRGRTARVRLSA